MKILEKLKLISKSIKSSIKRFPVTVFISTILTIFLIYLNEANLNSHSRDILIKINMLLGLAILLSLSIGLLLERLKNKNKTEYIILYGVGFIFLVLFYFLFLKSLNQSTIIRYTGTILFLILLSLYIQKNKKGEDYEYYIMNIFYNLALTLIYNFVLYFGMVAILFAMDSLLEIHINGSIYYYMFLLVFLIFGVSLFLSIFPDKDKKYGNSNYPNSLKLLLTYIVIPLIAIYTFILYLYFCKILLTKKWPKGLVSHLVLWYSTISVGIIFLLDPIIEENKIARIFKKIFPKIVLPILIMMFISIGKRVSQYGITESRYFIIALGIWVFGIMLYFARKKSTNNIIIPITLSIFILNSVYGPLSSFAISKYSQNKRFKNILENNNMIVNGKIVSSDKISYKDKKEINNIITYFDQNHEINNMTLLPKDFNTRELKDLMGFNYVPYNPYDYNDNRYFFYRDENKNKLIDIKGYDYYTLIGSWDNKKVEVGQLSIEYNKDFDTLEVSKGEDLLIKQDIKEFIYEIYKKNQNMSQTNKDSTIELEDMIYNKTYENEASKISIKLIFNNVNVVLDEDENMKVEGFEFILFISNE